MSRKRCKSTEILNPQTGRCVKRSGSVGRRILSSKCKSSQILNPVTGRCVKRTGSIGKKLLRRSRSPKHKKCKSNEILNPRTNRCVKRSGAIGRRLLGKTRSPSRLNRSPKRCKSNEILNPKTNRCVKRSGAIGKRLMASRSPMGMPKRCPPGQILNPNTNRCVKLAGRIGRRIIESARVGVSQPSFSLGSGVSISMSLSSENSLIENNLLDRSMLSEDDDEKQEYTCITNSRVPLKPIQVKAILHFIQYIPSLLVVFGTGVGKTLTALVASICYLDMYPTHEVIVVSPKSVLNNFEKESHKYGKVLPKDKYSFYTYDGFHNRFRDDARSCRNALFIIDEVHNYRSGGTNLGLNRYDTALKCAMLAHKRLFLTATPFVNNLKDIVNITKLLYGPEPAIINEQNVFEYLRNRVIYAPKILTEDFPQIEEHYVYVDMDIEYQRMYRAQLMEDTENRLFRDPQAFYNGNRRLVNSLGADKYCSMKLRGILNVLDADNTKQSIVYTNWIDFGLNVLEKTFTEIGIRFGSINGNVRDKERRDLVNKFNSRQLQVLIITAAGSEGIDLKGVENVFILDPVWHPAGIEQIIGRAVRYQSHLHLPPDRRVVHVYYLIMKEYDIETDMLDKLSYSGDVIMYRIINDKKAIENRVYQELQNVSIR